MEKSEEADEGVQTCGGGALYHAEETLLRSFWNSHTLGWLFPVLMEKPVWKRKTGEVLQ